MSPQFLMSVATGFTAIAAIGSWRVAALMRRGQRLRESCAEVYIDIGRGREMSTPAVYVWNDGPGTAYDVEVSARTVEGEQIPAKGGATLKPEEGRELTPGSCIYGKVGYRQDEAPNLEIYLRWSQEEPTFGLDRLRRRIRGLPATKRRCRTRVQAPGARHL